VSDAEVPSRPAAFSPRVMLAVLLTGVISFSAFAVLSVYAPDLRAGSDGGAHALSKSAVGFAGAVALLKARGVPVVVSRAPANTRGNGRSILVLTPSTADKAQEIAEFGKGQRVLVVLPKWSTTPARRRPGWVSKAGLEDPVAIVALLKTIETAGGVERRRGPAVTPIVGAPAFFGRRTSYPAVAVDRLQTLSGEGWQAVLVDDRGRMVLARARDGTFVLADPDLLNTQGLRQIANARVGLAALDMIRRGEDGVVFDVALNGFERPRDVMRLMFEPPLLAATLCAVAAALLLGLHALARFGPAAGEGRAFALGKRALVDNSAGLVRMARKEHELAPAYVRLTADLTARAVGADRSGTPAALAARLGQLARLRGPAESFDDLGAAAAGARTRGDLLAVARKLYDWRREMTRERR